jgi:hypothetical protein
VLKTDPGAKRWQPGLQQAVLGTFEFLRFYRLKPIETTPTLVGFESK